MNNCLEREVGELEEERRRLKAHLKFNAKYQGQIAVDLGLSPDQLSAIDQFVDQLKSSQQVSQPRCISTWVLVDMCASPKHVSACRIIIIARSARRSAPDPGPLSCLHKAAKPQA